MGRLSEQLGRKRMIVASTFGRGVGFLILAATAASFVALKTRILVLVVSFVVLSANFSAMFSGPVAFVGGGTP